MEIYNYRINYSNGKLKFFEILFENVIILLILYHNYLFIL